MLHKIGSNLSFKLDGNSVNSVNSARRLSYIAGELRMRSGHHRGRPWLRAGMEKALAWLPCASELRYKAFAVVVPRRFPSFVFLTPPPLLCRAFAVAVVPPPSQQDAQ